MKRKKGGKGKIYFYISLPLMIFVILSLIIIWSMVLYLALFEDWYYYNIYGKGNYKKLEIKYPRKF